MALSAFDDKAHPPTEEDIRIVLGKAHSLWLKLQHYVESEYAPISSEWGYSGKAYGWGLRLKTPMRAVLYMTPCPSYFLVSFALGEKAVTAAEASKLSSQVLDLIDNAPRYAEGRGVRLEVRSAAELNQVKLLAAIKMAN